MRTVRLTAQPTITPARVKQEYDLLAAQLRAGLIDDEDLLARRRELKRMEQESLRPYLARESHGADCVFCEEEATESQSVEMYSESEPMLVKPDAKGERVKGVPAGMRI